MRIRPCIDIHDGRVKQIVGGTLSDGNSSAGDNGKAQLCENFVSAEGASFYAGIYRDKNLSGGHIILLNSSADRDMYEADMQLAFEALKCYPGGMQVGGGITPEKAAFFLEAGASHVIVTSYVFRDGNFDLERILEMLKVVGKEHLTLDLSCRRAQDGNYYVVTDRWQKWTTLKVEETTLDMLSQYCDEFLIHAADVEGKRSGIERELVTLLGDWQKKSGFPVTYAGGVHKEEDIELIHRLSDGWMDVTVGSALDLFGGDLSLDELVSLAENL